MISVPMARHDDDDDDDDDETSVSCLHTVKNKVTAKLFTILVY